MPRPCGEGVPEFTDGVRMCWTVDVGHPSETAYLRAVFAWSVAIEAACVNARRS